MSESTGNGNGRSGLTLHDFLPLLLAGVTGLGASLLTQGEIQQRLTHVEGATLENSQALHDQRRGALEQMARLEDKLTALVLEVDDDASREIDKVLAPVLSQLNQIKESRWTEEDDDARNALVQTQMGELRRRLGQVEIKTHGFDLDGVER